MQYLGDFIGLIITVIVELALFSYVRKRSSQKSATSIYFSYTILCMIFWCISLIFQILVYNYVPSISPIYVDYFTYIFIAFTPVAMFFVGISFNAGSNFKVKKVYYLVTIIPFLTIYILWTNSVHGLFYEKYSVNSSEAVFGKYAYVHLLYTYGLFFVDTIILIRNSIKRSGALSRQSIFMSLSLIVPLVINILGITFFNMSVYVTPISLLFTLLFMTIAIFKYGFLNIAPIALKSIVNQMSDSYIVLNRNYSILDCNEPFEKLFRTSKSKIIGKDFTDLNFSKKIIINNKKIGSYLENAQSTSKVYKVDAQLDDNSKFFNIEISGIFSKKDCIGILILFKDTTQHVLDMEALKQNQNTLMERERLASLGQMIGGIAHNLKTPIMSIAGAMEGMNDLINEYEQSIDDPDVTKEDHHAIAKDMSEWVNKVNSYDSYLSDIITAVKGQSVNMNDDNSSVFTVEELLSRINILMKHELKNAFITLNVLNKTSEKTKLLGNINSLVQVVNNLISNAIQSYDGEPNNVIDLIIDKKDDNIIISVVDHGKGISKDIQKKLFSEMVTTKGQNGTGLGLFMSYSTIKGHFNGDMNFTSKVGVGTTFNIILPSK